jgi:hypothetical protein
MDIAHCLTRAPAVYAAAVAAAAAVAVAAAAAV